MFPATTELAERELGLGGVMMISDSWRPSVPITSSRLLLLLVGLVLGFAALGTAAPAAEAHDWCVKHPSDPDPIGQGKDNTSICVTNHHWMDICDRSADGHLTRGHYDTVFTPGSYTTTGWASFGDPCIRQSSWYAVTIRSLRVCVQEEGCSPWKFH
jgi:hypothetical protein